MRRQKRGPPRRLFRFLSGAEGCCPGTKLLVREYTTPGYIGMPLPILYLLFTSDSAVLRCRSCALVSRPPPSPLARMELPSLSLVTDTACPVLGAGRAAVNRARLPGDDRCRREPGHLLRRRAAPMARAGDEKYM